MNTSMKNVALATLLFAGMVGMAAAGSGGTEFQGLYEYFEGILSGYGGKTAIIAGIIVACLGAIAAGKPVLILIGIVLAVFIKYVPPAATGLLGALV